MPKIISSSCHLSRAPCRLTRTARPFCCSPLYLHPTSPALSGSCSTSFQPRTFADPHGLRGDGFTESEPRTGYEPKTVGDKKVVDIFNPIVTEQEGAHSTEDHKHYSTEESQIPEIDDKFFTLQPVIIVFVPRFHGKPCHASRSRLGRRTNSCSAGFITVLAGARSNCGTITNLSL